MLSGTRVRFVRGSRWRVTGRLSAGRRGDTPSSCDVGPPRPVCCTHTHTHTHTCSPHAIACTPAQQYALNLNEMCSCIGYALSAGIEGDDIPWNRTDIDPKEEHFYSGGKALDLRWAQLSIGGQDYQADLEDDEDGKKASYAKFSVDLEEGEDQLFAAFYGKEGAVRAPYYIYIAKE